MPTAIAGDHIDKNHQPSKLSSYSCNIKATFKQSDEAILFAGIPVQGTKYCE